MGFCGGYLAHNWESVLADGEGAASWSPSLRGDVNDDGKLNICDAVYILNYLFKAGEEPAPVPQGRGGVLQTGQVGCWSGTHGEEQKPCPQPGEDDHGQDPQFKEDGFPHDFELFKPDPEDRSTWYTVDHATSLMWQYQADTTLRNWRDALKFVSELELAGHDDWRMPNINELYTLVDISQRTPAAYKSFFFLFPNKYWSSSSCAVDLSRAWTVDFSLGLVLCLDKGGQGQNSFKFRTLAVRALR
ncbi:MAG: DUF1566 domain-containing protein [Planctomycetes bacterium]|nr:DUF1566 domain-containing protein [Planctomycetota bacterium]